VDSCVGFTELITEQCHTSVQSDETVKEIVAIKTEMKQIKEEIKKMSRNMNTLQNTLSGFLDKLA
jgi:peptidoglycan hydrolase CwlO-like protein